MQNNKNENLLINLNKENIYWNKHREAQKYILNLIGLYQDQILTHLNNQTYDTLKYEYDFKENDLYEMFQTHLMIRDFFTSWDNRDMFQEIINVLEFLFKNPFLFFETINLTQLPKIFQQGFLFDFLNWIRSICEFIQNTDDLKSFDTFDTINYFAPNYIMLKKEL